MQFDYVRASGRARLDAGTFEALVTPMSPPTELVERLVAVGAARADGTASPDLAPLVAAVRDPWCVLQVSVAGGAGRQVHQAWLRDDLAALLLQVTADHYDFFAVLPESVPSAVARVVRLGPRKQAPRTVTAVAAADLATCWEGELAAAGEVLDDLGGREDRWLWRAEMAWPGADADVVGRLVEGMAGPEGWWLLRGDGHEPAYVPTTPTILWQLFIDLMPTDQELEQVTSR